MCVVPPFSRRGDRHLSFAENSGARVPVIGSRLRQQQPVHFAVTNGAKVGREGEGTLLIWTAESCVGT